MKKQLLLFAMILLPLVASAEPVEIDGIYYNLVTKAKQAEVTSNPNTYTGNVVIPEKVTYENVEYSVTSIGGYAFTSCTGLTSITIPNSVTSIGGYAFTSCKGLTSVTIPNSVTSIGSYAFYYCSGLRKVIVKDIAAWCGIKFDGNVSNPLYYAKHIYSDENTEITNLVIPNSVTSIGNYAFYECSSLTSVTIPNSVTSIGISAFYECSGLKKVIVKDIAAWCGIKFDNSDSNPLFYAKHLYSDEDTEITNLIIPNSMTSIGNNAFQYCSGLTSVTIPNSVTSIGSNAFEGCSGLTSVTIPNSVTSIGSNAFEGCSGLTSITIPNSVTSIGSSAFEGCSGLTSITIPNSVTSIGISAFYECSGLTSVTIPNSVTSIGYGAFSHCSGLTSVTIPNSVTSIGSNAFEGCSGLTSITIPNSVTSIGSGMFSGCSGLTSVTIPNSVTSIGSGMFFGCSGLTSVTIPNSVTSIGGFAFYGCTGLTSITIPNSVTSIGGSAFFGCSSLTSVTIGSGIIYIYSSAFASCPELTDVTCYAENVPSTGTDAFKDSYIEYATLHVPSASVNAYKAANPWKNFKSIVTIDGETPTTQKCEKPTISYENGQLKFASATDGVEFISEITDSDIKKNYEATVSLTATYTISVYATKSGYDNSETATATLCWIDASPKTEGITNGIANIPANAVLIQSEGGSIKVQGVDEGTQVNVYGINGTQAGSAISQSGAATINTNLQPGSIAIVKIGQKSVKVVIK